MTYSEKLNILVKNTIEDYSNCEEVTTYKKYYDNMQYYNTKYLKKVDLFFTENTIDQSLFFEGLEKYRIIPMLEKLKDNTQNIILNFEKYWLELNRIDKRFLNVYGTLPMLNKDMLYSVRSWLFDNNYGNDMLTLEEQNDKMKKYIHFDASMKKIKTVA